VSLLCDSLTFLRQIVALFCDSVKTGGQLVGGRPPLGATTDVAGVPVVEESNDCSRNGGDGDDDRAKHGGTDVINDHAIPRPANNRPYVLLVPVYPPTSLQH